MEGLPALPADALERLRGQERSPGGREARSVERAAVDLLYSIAQAGSGGPCTEQAGLGWLGWVGLGRLAGLQSAGCSVPEDSVPFGRGPAGCGSRLLFPQRDRLSLPVNGRAPP